MICSFKQGGVKGLMYEELSKFWKGQGVRPWGVRQEEKPRGKEDRSRDGVRSGGQGAGPS